MLRILTLLALIGTILVVNKGGYADELSDARAFWDSSAFSCPAEPPNYPSKEVLGNPTECDDGDMTLFNGLLCSAGISAGCEAVARSQGVDGRWWRSPRRIGWEAPEHDVSFSPDQSLGVLLYSVRRKDATNFSRWLTWLETNRPCAFEVGGRCVQRGWLRFCRDDQEDKRCTLRPADCVRIEMVAQKLGVDGQLCRRVMRELNIPEDLLLPIDEFLRASAVVNDPGYPMHLVGVGILLARQSGLQTEKLDQAAGILAARETGNPFFQFLHEGPTANVRAALLSVCPAPDRPSAYRFQWVWERVPKAESWRESMYWECLFLHDVMYPPA